MQPMRTIALGILAVFLVFSSACAGEEEGFTFKSRPEIEQVQPKKPVRIKLRRLSTGEYTWEITGDNAQEVIKADQEMRKSFATD